MKDIHYRHLPPDPRSCPRPSSFSNLLTGDDACTLTRRKPTTRHVQQVDMNAFYVGSSSPVLLDARVRARTGSSSLSTQVLLVVLAHSSSHRPPTPPIFPNRPTPPRPSAQASYAYKRSDCSLRCSVSSCARRKVMFFSLHPSLLFQSHFKSFLTMRHFIASARFLIQLWWPNPLCVITKVSFISCLDCCRPNFLPHPSSQFLARFSLFLCDTPYGPFTFALCRITSVDFGSIEFACLSIFCFCNDL
jgi:hypothetical protein